MLNNALRSLFVFFSLVLCFGFYNAKAQWQPTNGPFGGSISTMMANAQSLRLYRWWCIFIKR